MAPIAMLQEASIEQAVTRVFVPDSSLQWRSGVCQPTCDPGSDMQQPSVREHPLAAPCKDGDAERLHVLLTGGSDAVKAPWGENGKAPTPLVIAVLRGHRGCHVNSSYMMFSEPGRPDMLRTSTEGAPTAAKWPLIRSTVHNGC